MYKLVTSRMVLYLFRPLSIVLSFGVLLVFCSCLFRVYFLVLILLLLVFVFWVFFGYSKSYFSVNSNKDNITDTVVYVSFLFIYFFGQTIKLQNIAKVCCVYTSTY